MKVFKVFVLAMFFSKACQYATTNEKVCRNFRFISIKSTKSYLQKCITWLKKSGKGRQEWNKAFSNFNLPPKKLNIPMKQGDHFIYCNVFSKLLSFLFLIDLF
jgi:hypothetical protein